MNQARIEVLRELWQQFDNLCCVDEIRRQQMLGRTRKMCEGESPVTGSPRLNAGCSERTLHALAKAGLYVIPNVANSGEILNVAYGTYLCAWDGHASRTSSSSCGSETLHLSLSSLYIHYRLRFSGFMSSVVLMNYPTIII